MRNHVSASSYLIVGLIAPHKDPSEFIVQALEIAVFRSKWDGVRVLGGIERHFRGRSSHQILRGVSPKKCSISAKITFRIFLLTFPSQRRSYLHATTNEKYCIVITAKRRSKTAVNKKFQLTKIINIRNGVG